MKKIEITSEGMSLFFVFENKKLGIQFTSDRGDPGCCSIVLDNITPAEFLTKLEGFRQHHVFNIENTYFKLAISIDPKDQRFGDYPTLTWSVSAIQTNTLIVEGWMVCSVEEFMKSVSQLIG